MSITVEGSLAVVISSYDLMYIFDVSIIQSPILLTKSERLFSDPRQLVLNENLLYVADIYNGLVIVDLTNITEPEIISTTKATEGWGGIYAFEKKGSFIYISGSGFFSIIDVTNKTAPELLTSLTLGDYYCPGIAVNDNLAIVTLYLSLIHI